RSNLFQGSWNFERMQALGFCFSMVPVILVKPGGFDLLQALSKARRTADRIGVTHLQNAVSRATVKGTVVVAVVQGALGGLAFLLYRHRRQL
ncbi:PrpR N-terminal domain-containing protein, partial [Serratia ureilytica]|nr:PrpR N-terminal domain-containing protein [Serratia ureilytica]